MSDMRFRDRAEAGRLLAEPLAAYADREDVIVLALPRGGVPVAAALAEVLHLPMDVFLVRKLGVPGHEEYAMGAIASGGLRWLNERVVQARGLRTEDVERVVRRETAELERRAALYRAGASAPEVAGRIAILVDDGLATGATMRVAARGVHALNPRKLIIAVPVGASESCEDLRSEADEVLCLRTPPGFRAVGQWYQNFAQTTDAEVIELLQRARTRSTTRGAETGNAH